MNGAARRRSSAPASTTRPSCGRRAFWEKLYEPVIRRAAGLGRAAGAPDPDHYEKAYAFLRRAGHRRRPGGPGGGARRRARPARASILCDEDFELGGTPARRAARDRRRAGGGMGRGGRRRTRGAAQRPHHAADDGVRRL